MDSAISWLEQLYLKASKHSGYQIVHDSVLKLFTLEVNQNINRFEKERFEFIKSHISFNKKKVLDIGGNTGYFSIEAIENGAESVLHMEGNRSHSDFVKELARNLDYPIVAENRYLSFSIPSEITQKVDIILALNVLHHLGDDFGDTSLSMQAAKVQIQMSIKYLSAYTEYLILQLGFCWKGCRSNLLFENGTKKEMIDFVIDATHETFDLLNIGVAELINSRTEYRELSDTNIERDDSLGEFRNRPIFILKRKQNEI